MNIYSSKRLKVASRHSPGQKRRKHIQEALVKETVLNNEIEGSEQRRVLSVGRDVCYTTDCQTQPYGARRRHSSPEDKHMVKWPSMVYTICYHPDLLRQNSARASAERVTTRAAKSDLRAVSPECVEKIPESNLFACTDFLLSRLVGATDAATLFDGVSDEIAPC